MLYTVGCKNALDTIREQILPLSSHVIHPKTSRPNPIHSFVDYLGKQLDMGEVEWGEAKEKINGYKHA